MTATFRRSGFRELSRSKRVLVVDDNADSGELLGLLLERAGHEPHVTDSPFAALTAATTFRPHIALIDIGLPGMDGCELCAQLRAQPELVECRFIAVTGYSGPEAVARTVAAGFEGHLTKPVSVDDLLLAVAGGGQPQSAAR